MVKLNLTATNKQEELILAYLQENASETLADKINNGMPFEKDGKTLINKKTLSGFMKYACDEARKLTEKGASSACVDDATVYGWAMHYFEEDSIEGTLYTIDGEEYKPVVVKPKTTQKSTYTPTSAAKPKPQNLQFSIFDRIDEKDVKETANDTLTAENDTNTVDIDDDSDMPTEEEMQEAMQIVAEEESKNVIPKHEDTPLHPTSTTLKEPNPIYIKYKELKEHYPDCVVAYRLGDFYEILGQDAVTLATKLDMILTSRDCGLEKRIPMIGFPYHAATNYISKITENGLKIAVVETDGKINIQPRERNEYHSIDKETGEIIYDDMTEEEMREFDGDISEIPEPRFATESNDILSEEKTFAKAFDSEALCELSDLLGDEFILV